MRETTFTLCHCYIYHLFSSSCSSFHSPIVSSVITLFLSCVNTCSYGCVNTPKLGCVNTPIFGRVTTTFFQSVNTSFFGQRPQRGRWPMLSHIWGIFSSPFSFFFYVPRSNPSLEAHIPVLRPKSQSWGPNPNLQAQIPTQGPNLSYWIYPYHFVNLQLING